MGIIDEVKRFFENPGSGRPRQLSVPKRNIEALEGFRKRYISLLQPFDEGGKAVAPGEVSTILKKLLAVDTSLAERTREIREALFPRMLGKIVEAQRVIKDSETAIKDVKKKGQGTAFGDDRKKYAEIKERHERRVAMMREVILFIVLNVFVLDRVHEEVVRLQAQIKKKEGIVDARIASQRAVLEEAKRARALDKRAIDIAVFADDLQLEVGSIAPELEALVGDMVEQIRETLDHAVIFYARSDELRVEIDVTDVLEINAGEITDVALVGKKAVGVLRELKGGGPVDEIRALLDGGEELTKKQIDKYVKMANEIVNGKDEG